MGKPMVFCPHGPMGLTTHGVMRQKPMGYPWGHAGKNPCAPMDKEIDSPWGKSLSKTHG